MDASPTLNLKYITKNMWLQPEAVFKQIKEQQYYKYAYHLFFWAGFLSTASDALQDSYSSTLSFVLFVTLVPLLSGGLSIVFGYLIYMLIAAIGKKLGGQSDTETLFKSLSYCQIPGILFSIVGIVLGALGVSEDSSLAILIPIGILALVYFIWNLVIFLQALATVQEYSVGSALGTLVLSIIAVVAIVLIPIFIFVVIGAMF